MDESGRESPDFCLLIHHTQHLMWPRRNVLQSIVDHDEHLQPVLVSLFITLTVPPSRRSVSLLLLMLCGLCRAAGALIHHRNRLGRKRLCVDVARCRNDRGAH